MTVRVGTEFRSVYADSNALWKVTGKAGAGVWHAEIVNEKIKLSDGRTIDGDYAGTVDVFTTQKIESCKGVAALFEGYAARSADWWDSLSVGDIVHYDSSFGQFVRGEIVREDGENKMKPIALVGAWHKMDLPRRFWNGTEMAGTFARDILSGDPKSLRPSSSCMYEALDFTKKGKITDPRTLDPIDLTIPAPTDAEAVIIGHAKVRQRVLDILDDADANNVVRKLHQARTLLLKEYGVG